MAAAEVVALAPGERKPRTERRVMTKQNNWDCKFIEIERDRRMKKIKEKKDEKNEEERNQEQKKEKEQCKTVTRTTGAAGAQKYEKIPDESLSVATAVAVGAPESELVPGFKKMAVAAPGPVQ